MCQHCMEQTNPLPNLPPAVQEALFLPHLNIAILSEHTAGWLINH